MKFKGGRIRNDILTRLRMLLKKHAEAEMVKGRWGLTSDDPSVLQLELKADEQWRKLIGLLTKVSGNCKKEA